MPQHSSQILTPLDNGSFTSGDSSSFAIELQSRNEKFKYITTTPVTPFEKGETVVEDTNQQVGNIKKKSIRYPELNDHLKGKLDPDVKVVQVSPLTYTGKEQRDVQNVLKP